MKLRLNRIHHIRGSFCSHRRNSDSGSSEKAQRLLRGSRREQLTSVEDRQQFILWIHEAIDTGARLKTSCRQEK